MVDDFQDQRTGELMRDDQRLFNLRILPLLFVSGFK